MMLTFNTDRARSIAVTDVSAAFPIDLGTDGSEFFSYAATIDTWITQGTSPVAVAAGDGCVYVPAGERISFSRYGGTSVAAIRAGATNGTGNLAPVGFW